MQHVVLILKWPILLNLTLNERNKLIEEVFSCSCTWYERNQKSYQIAADSNVSKLPSTADNIAATMNENEHRKPWRKVRFPNRCEYIEVENIFWSWSNLNSCVFLTIRTQSELIVRGVYKFSRFSCIFRYAFTYIMLKLARTEKSTDVLHNAGSNCRKLALGYHRTLLAYFSDPS